MPASVLPANVERGSLADVRAEVIRELIRAAEVSVVNCKPCGGKGFRVVRVDYFPVIGADYHIRAYAVPGMDAKERCQCCSHLRGVITLAREMIPDEV